MALQNENFAQNIPVKSSYQAGVSDVDQNLHPDDGILLPWCINPELSFLDYFCWIECELDSGIVMHVPLPQSAQPIDSLGVGDYLSANMRKSKTDGVNLVSKGKFENIVQRMATSEYRFCLKGWGRRAGYQIPIPRLVKLGNLEFIPDDQQPQRAYNRLIGNYSGVPVWYAQWALWYTLAEPPKQAPEAPPLLSQQMYASDPVPKGIQVPISVPDSLAVTNAPRVSTPPDPQ